MSDDNIYKDLRQLGGETRVPQSPEEAELERVPNPQADTACAVRFTAPEFTSLCPMTGQPDFAHLVIDYVPGAWLVESKSLKLYLTSFRNHGAFHEDCTLTIARRLVDFLAPQWLRIGGYWYPRGGIPIDVLWAEVPPPATLAGMTLIIASGLYIGWRETRITRRGDTQPSIAGSTFAPGHLPPPQGPGDARAP